MNPDTPNREQLELWLSKPRFARYLKAAKGDGELALELYIWNTGLSQAVLRDVSFFEIALRNAYSRCFDENWHGKDHWLFDDTSPLRKPILRKNKRKALVDANRINRKSIDRLAGNLGADATSDNVIANLTLGFWTHLSDRNHERDVWMPCIYSAWPKGTARKQLNQILTSINQTRNRAAHHEHLFATQGESCTTASACRDAVKLFSMLQSEVALYIYGDQLVSTVDEFLEANPAPVSIHL